MVAGHMATTAGVGDGRDEYLFSAHLLPVIQARFPSRGMVLLIVSVDLPAFINLPKTTLPRRLVQRLVPQEGLNLTKLTFSINHPSHTLILSLWF